MAYLFPIQLSVEVKPYSFFKSFYFYSFLLHILNFQLLNKGLVRRARKVFLFQWIINDPKPLFHGVVEYACPIYETNSSFQEATAFLVDLTQQVAKAEVSSEEVG